MVQVQHEPHHLRERRELRGLSQRRRDHHAVAVRQAETAGPLSVRTPDTIGPSRCSKRLWKAD